MTKPGKRRAKNRAALPASARGRTSATRLLSAVVLFSVGAFAYFSRDQGVAQEASERFVKLTIEGELSAATREALRQVLAPPELEELLLPGLADAVPASQVCSRRECSSAVAEAFELTTSTDMSDVIFADVRHESPLVAIVPDLTDNLGSIKPYVVLKSDSPVFTAYDVGKITGEVVAAVPVEWDKVFSDAWTDVPSASAVLLPLKYAIPSDASKTLDIIDQDLEENGVSSRELRLRPGITEGQVAALIQTFANEPSAEAAFSSIPIEDVSLIQPPLPVSEGNEESVSFQSSVEQCEAQGDDWPFDAESVANVMQFNETVLERVGIGTARRAKVLVVDTGVGRSFVETPDLRSNLYPSPLELMSAHLVFRNDFGDPNSRSCPDADGNGYRSDVYGGSPKDEESSRCSPDYFIERLQPIPKLEGASQQYLPGHGSFVGALAIGGPRLLGLFPSIRRFVGVSFFRITRPPIHQSQSVKVDPSDISNALLYANATGADVVNLSLKTKDDTVFNEDLKLDAFIVGAAGNASENLDNSTSSLPATLSEGNPLRHQMLIVAALQQSEDTPLWPSSARSVAKVEIAAPGAQVISLGEAGERVCMSGTSAAAPLVSFTAAALKSLGIESNRLIKARILSAADREPKINKEVNGGRKLNIAAALDVFVDQVWVEGESAPRRGWIDPETTPPLFLLCREETAPSLLAASKGKIDLHNLLWWERAGGTVDNPNSATANFEHRINRDAESDSCDVPVSSFAFWNKDGSTQDIAWSEVKRILPSPFRSVKRIVTTMPLEN